jgi:ADP-ribose pyrophosphatase YjhB (NUDIX family)
MDYCSRCGQRTEQRIPEGEDRHRHVCSSCGAIHYQNPRMIVGCIALHEGRVLMCQRAIDPRRGYWTLPAGFLELGESAMAGAERETREEAGAHVRIIAPYLHFDVPHIGQAYILYRAELLSPELAPGAESLAVKLALPDEIPVTELAFPVVRHALDLIQEDLRSGRFRAHQGVLAREAGTIVLRDHLQVTLER